MRWLLLLTPLIGCTAAKGTYHMIEAEHDFALASQAEAADVAVYSWTMAESYMRKAREEYAAADYEAAQTLAAEGARWSARARNIAEGLDIDPMQTAPDILPEVIQRDPEEQPPTIAPEQEDLVVPDEDEVDEDEFDFEEDEEAEGDW